MLTVVVNVLGAGIILMAVIALVASWSLVRSDKDEASYTYILGNAAGFLTAFAIIALFLIN